MVDLITFMYSTVLLFAQFTLSYGEINANMLHDR